MEKLFSTEPLERVAFVDRPNRFVVRFRGPGGRPRLAFMANPGRLGENLLRLRHGIGCRLQA